MSEYDGQMLATVINAVSVIIGAIVGVLIAGRVNDRFSSVIYTAIGVVTLIIGMQMAFEGQRVVYLALSLVIGGLVGTALGIENAIMRLGEWLKTRVGGSKAEGTFAQGFLDASVLFCVGALTIVGSFQAGAEGNYELLLTKSVMDGFMALLLAAALGRGVAFSALTILVYQGGLTLAAGLLRGTLSPLLLSEISAVGGALVLMIGLNLLQLREVKTANFIPALLVILLFVALDPHIGRVLGA